LLNYPVAKADVRERQATATMRSYELRRLFRATGSDAAGGRAVAMPPALPTSPTGIARLLPECCLRRGSRLGILNHWMDVTVQDISPVGHVLGDERQVTRLDKMPAEG
jgi:hypothetical protein